MESSWKKNKPQWQPQHLYSNPEIHSQASSLPFPKLKATVGRCFGSNSEWALYGKTDKI